MAIKPQRYVELIVQRKTLLARQLESFIDQQLTRVALGLTSTEVSWNTSGTVTIRLASHHVDCAEAFLLKQINDTVTPPSDVRLYNIDKKTQEVIEQWYLDAGWKAAVWAKDSNNIRDTLTLTFPDALNPDPPPVK